MKSAIFAVAALCFCTPALAANIKAGACVQKELSQLQFYSGPIDGLVGPGTRHAGDQYIAWMKGGAGGAGWNQPPLTAGNADFWCEKVAGGHSEVAKYYKAYLKGQY